MSDEVRPFPVEKFTDRLNESLILNQAVGEQLDKAFADGKHILILGIGTPKRGELAAFYNVGKGLSFGGFVKLESHQKVDYGVAVRFAR